VEAVFLGIIALADCFTFINDFGVDLLSVFVLVLLSIFTPFLAAVFDPIFDPVFDPVFGVILGTGLAFTILVGLGSVIFSELITESPFKVKAATESLIGKSLAKN
jgi:hypothetical protein